MFSSSDSRRARKFVWNYVCSVDVRKSFRALGTIEVVPRQIVLTDETNRHFI